MSAPPPPPEALPPHRPPPHLLPLYALVHSARVLGYAPLAAYSLLRWPRKAISAAAAYYALRFASPRWRAAVRRTIARGSSQRPRLLRAQSRPYERGRQYLIASHPHGILNYGWWNVFARCGEGLSSCFDGVEPVMCMAPAVRWYPLYGELLEDRGTDPSASTIRRILRDTTFSPALIPGGFSEACYTNASPVVEYAYIADRTGFLRLAIEAGVDIIVTYTYGLNDMYRTLEWRRHWRAVKAQEWGLPLVYWWGPLGKICGNVPYTEDVTVATFDPFPASKYTLDQLPQAHADYMRYLKQCFDSRKGECGYLHKRLEFIGKTKPPERTQVSSMPVRSKL
ncbi:hypothetical protein AB1Y20_005939 [Prymnesium parvum]|uniref:Acyltransferase n=1 Tax=Prymnesium parvum TaxID=97485 RepID=A0AB34J184_PRYPA